MNNKHVKYLIKFPTNIHKYHIVGTTFFLKSTALFDFNWIFQ